MKVKEDGEKAGLKLNIQKTKIMESGPITSWEIDGETTEALTDFIFLSSKLTVDDTCSLEVKQWQNETAYKIRDITLPTNVHIVKAMVFL